MSIYPFNLIRDKEFNTINAIEIKEPCTQCGGECFKFDRIQCDECDKWTHQVCSSLTKREFEEIGKTSDEYICSKKCEQSKFPFSSLSKQKLLITTGEVEEIIKDSSTPGVVAREAQGSPEVDEISEDEPHICCDYLDTNQLDSLGLVHGTTDLSLFHGNVGSLSNLHKLEDVFRDQMKMPDIIGVTETKLPLSEKDKEHRFKNAAINIELKGYHFVDCPTPTDAGGAGIYISKNLQYEERKDLALNLDRVEDIWIQLNNNNKSIKGGSQSHNLVIGVVYRHPGSQYKEFEKKMCDIVAGLNRNKTNFVIMGDTNINLLKMNIVTDVTNYINNLQSAGCLSLVDRATRVVWRGTRWQTSCVSHIYTNVNIENTETNIITSAISDHFSVFTKLKNMKSKHIPKTDVYTRKKILSQVEITNFNNELQTKINNLNFDNTNVHELAEQLVDIYKDLIDKYMPLRKLSRKEKSFWFKPWLTRGIITSMNTRDALHRESLKSDNEEDHKYYKRYKNFVTRMQNKSYNDYHSKNLEEHQKNNNKKKIWESINEIANYKRKKTTEIKWLAHEGTQIRGTKEITNCLNTHFNSIGKRMAEKIHNPNTTNFDNLSHIPEQINSLFLRPTTVEELIKLIRALELHKAPGPDGINSYVIKKNRSSDSSRINEII